MPNTTARKVFVNLAVRDLPRAKAFFSALGFAYDTKFTDDNAACMLVGEDAYVMLLMKPFFSTFSTRPLCDTTTRFPSGSRN